VRAIGSAASCEALTRAKQRNYESLTQARATAWDQAGSFEEAFQATLIRDIYGNVFRPLPALEPAWLIWNDKTVPQVARTIYEQHSFEGLPILADALEEAGCTNPTILGHCRG